MTANKTVEILQQQIDKLNQEQTETKWNEKDKKLFEKFLELVYDDPFRIFYADGGEVHRILELVYPDSVKGRIEELFRIKYVYDGFLKYGEVVKPQVEKERPNLEILIKDISDYYLDVYRNQKKVKENAIKNYRMVLEKSNRKHYITLEDCDLLLELAERSNRTVDEKVLLLAETLENNNAAIQELLKQKIVKKVSKAKPVEPPQEEIEDVVEPMEEPEEIDMIEPEETASEASFIEPEEIMFEAEMAEELPFEEEPVEIELEEELEELEEEIPLEEEIEEIEEELENPMIDTLEDNTREEPKNIGSYIELYLHALEEIDPADIQTINNVLPKSYMPNFNEIMDSLLEALKKQIHDIKEEEKTSEVKRVRILREELGRAQQLLKTMNNYLEKQSKKDSETREKIVEGEEIQLLLLETEDGDSLIERDFKKQLDESQYKTAMDLLQCLERFSNPAVRKKAKQSTLPGILELQKDGVHIFFEPFAENTYIVIALLAEKNGYSSWIEDKLRLRHSLFQRQEKGMQRRWNQHGTRNTMLLGSETAYLEMQDIAEKR